MVSEGSLVPKVCPINNIFPGPFECELQVKLQHFLNHEEQ